MQNDNARPDIAHSVLDSPASLKFEVVPHPPYNPDPVPSDFHSFPELRRTLKGIHFKLDNEIKTPVKSFIKSKLAKFFIVEMKKLVTNWQKSKLTVITFKKFLFPFDNCLLFSGYRRVYNITYRPALA